MLTGRAVYRSHILSALVHVLLAALSLRIFTLVPASARRPAPGGARLLAGSDRSHGALGGLDGPSSSSDASRALSNTPEGERARPSSCWLFCCCSSGCFIRVTGEPRLTDAPTLCKCVPSSLTKISTSRRRSPVFVRETPHGSTRSEPQFSGGRRYRQDAWHCRSWPPAVRIPCRPQESSRRRPQLPADRCCRTHPDLPSRPTTRHRCSSRVSRTPRVRVSAIPTPPLFPYHVAVQMLR